MSVLFVLVVVIKALFVISQDSCNPSGRCLDGDCLATPGRCYGFNWCANSVWRWVNCTGGVYTESSVSNCSDVCATTDNSACAVTQISCPVVTVTEVSLPPQEMCDSNYTCKGLECLPDKNSCSRFYECTGFGSKPVERNCSTGTFFKLSDNFTCLCDYLDFDEVCGYRCETTAPEIPTTLSHEQHTPTTDSTVSETSMSQTETHSVELSSSTTKKPTTPYPTSRTTTDPDVHLSTDTAPPNGSSFPYWTIGAALGGVLVIGVVVLAIIQIRNARSDDPDTSDSESDYETI